LVTEALAIVRDAVVVAFDPNRETAFAGVLGREGAVTHLSSPGLALLRLSEATEEPRKLWTELLGRCAAATWVAPVLRDTAGNELFPTGALVVRFRERPSAEALASFTTQHGLCLERRNEFIPEQVSLRPTRPRDVFLPELVESLARLPEVVAAWAATISRYRHAPDTTAR
jgi:hypothetical protein